MQICTHCSLLVGEHYFGRLCPGMGGEFEYEPSESEETDTEMKTQNLLMKGINQVIVVMSSKEVAEKTGIYGYLSLCFGTTENDTISQIHLIKNEQGRFMWRPPQVLVVDTITKPMFRGRIAEEINAWAQEAYDLIKQTFGRAKFGHKYRVAGGKAFDETEEAAGAVK